MGDPANDSVFDAIFVAIKAIEKWPEYETAEKLLPGGNFQSGSHFSILLAFNEALRDHLTPDLLISLTKQYAAALELMPTEGPVGSCSDQTAFSQNFARTIKALGASLSPEMLEEHNKALELLPPKLRCGFSCFGFCAIAGALGDQLTLEMIVPLTEQIMVTVNLLPAEHRAVFIYDRLPSQIRHLGQTLTVDVLKQHNTDLGSVKPNNRWQTPIRARQRDDTFPPL